jgi:hypothetical protein
MSSKLSISDQREGGVYNTKMSATVVASSISDQREGGVYNSIIVAEVSRHQDGSDVIDPSLSLV